MTGSPRCSIRSLGVLLVLALALVATSAIAPSTASAGLPCKETPSNPSGECGGGSSIPDACPDMAGMQTSAAECVAPAPTPAPAPAPAAAASTPDEGFVAPTPVEYDHEGDALTLQTAQADPAATTGGEVTVDVGAADAAATAPGGGTSSAAAIPSGPLPYTGATTTNVAMLAIVFLWLGAVGHISAGMVRRRRAVADAA